MNHVANHLRKPIKVGQIGIGHNHASEKMATLRKLPHRFEVVGIVEADPTWMQQRSQFHQYKDLPWLTEEQLLNTPDLQAVFVETDVPDLVATACRCLDAGMHIHLDKPGGESLAEFSAMLDLAQRKNLTVQLGYMFRNNPAVQLCLQAVRDGWLGNVFEVSAVMSRMADPSYRQWMSQFQGGCMYIFGCHLIDLVVSLLGKPDRVTPFLQQTHPQTDKLIDNGFAVLQYPTAVASIRATVIEVDGFRRRQLVVCGDEGTFDLKPIEGRDVQSLDPPLPQVKPRLTLSKSCGVFKAGGQDVTIPAMTGRYIGQLTELAQIIYGEIQNPYSLEHELIVQKVLLKACGCPPEST